jgi:hypothetical protein
MINNVGHNASSEMGSQSDCDLKAQIAALKQELKALKTENDFIACENELSDITSELSEISVSIANKQNPYSLMTSSLPEGLDFSSLASATSNSAESVEVKTVRRNLDFKKKQMEFTRSKRKEFSQREMIDTFPC